MYEHPYNPYSANIAVVKGYLKSGKVLALGILNLLSLILSVVTALLPTNTFLNSFLSYLSSLGVDTSAFSGYINEYISGSMNVSSIISTFISSIFTILSIVAFFIIFAKSRNSDPESNPSGGVGILRTLSVITFVFAIIAVVLIVLLYVLFIIAISSVNEYFDGDVEKATIFQVTAGIIVSFLVFFLLSYASSQKNFYRSVKRSLNSVDLYTSGSVAFGVFNIIFAVFTGLSLVSTVIFTVAVFNSYTLLSLLSYLVTFVTLIMTASFAIGYNRYIKREKSSYRSGASRGSAPRPARIPDDDAQNPYAPSRQRSYSDNRYRGYNDDPYGGYSDDGYRSYNEPPQSAPSYQDNYSAPQSDSYQDNYSASQSDPYQGGYSAPYQDSYNAPQPMYCPNCGAPTEENAPFCPNCGTKL